MFENGDVGGLSAANCVVYLVESAVWLVELVYMVKRVWCCGWCERCCYCGYCRGCEDVGGVDDSRVFTV